MNINRKKNNPIRRKMIEILSCFLPIFPKNLQPKTPPHRRTGYHPASSSDKLQSSPLNLKPIIYNLKPNLGFTLLEMLVSISVFLVVMLVASSSLLSIIDANQKAQSLKSAINNLNFALESMEKNIRVGTNYSASGCSSANTCIIFDSYKDLDGMGDFDNLSDLVIYRHNGNSIERCETTPSIKCDDPINDPFTRMTSAEVKITDMKFYISSLPTPQRVLITISGKAGAKEKTQTKFNLQTTVSQRTF